MEKVQSDVFGNPVEAVEAVRTEEPENPVDEVVSVKVDPNDTKKKEIKKRKSASLNAVAYFYKKQKKKIDKKFDDDIWYWSLDGYFSPSYSIHCTANTHDSDYSLQTSLIEQKPAFSYTLGANIIFHTKNTILQTGITYTSLREKLYCSENITRIDSSYYYDYFETTYFETVIVDSYYQVSNGDTTWYYVNKEEWITKTDSSLITDYDTVVAEIENEYLNKYSYLQVPFIIGYSFDHRKFTYSVKGGIVACFFIKAQGRTIKGNENTDVVVTNDLPFKSPYFLFQASVGISYNLYKNTSLFLEPRYKCSINSLYKNYYSISHKYHSFGINFGLKYKF